MQKAMRELPNFGIQSEVRLVVFGFDNDQKNGANWSGHRDKLKFALGDKLLLKGEAKDFTNGITFAL